MQAFDQSCDGCLFGNPLSNFPDEYWLNINPGVKGINPNTGRSETTRQFLLDEMLARVKEAKLIGVDAIEFDDVDAYQSHSGLSITPAAQLPYNAALANLAHRMGLSVGLKNDRDQADALQPYFDFGIEEECWAERRVRSGPGLAERSTARRCSTWSTGRRRSAFCPQSNSPQFDFNSIREDRRPVRSPVQAVPVVTGTASLHRRLRARAHRQPARRHERAMNSVATGPSLAGA